MYVLRLMFRFPPQGVKTLKACTDGYIFFPLDQVICYIQYVPAGANERCFRVGTNGLLSLLDNRRGNSVKSEGCEDACEK